MELPSGPLGGRMTTRRKPRSSSFTDSDFSRDRRRCSVMIMIKLKTIIKMIIREMIIREIRTALALFFSV